MGWMFHYLLLTKIYVHIYTFLPWKTVFLYLFTINIIILLCCELHWNYWTSLAAVPNIILGKVQ
jgi:hypothetical protein